MIRQKYNEEIQSRNNISYPENQQLNNERIRDIEREKYKEFLLNKNKEKEEQGGPYYDREAMERNYNANNNEMMNYPNRQEQFQNNANSKYYSPNQEEEYYNNNIPRTPLQNNNYISERDYQNAMNKEGGQRYNKNEEDPKYLSYHEQIERMKMQDQYLEKEKSRNIPWKKSG